MYGEIVLRSFHPVSDIPEVFSIGGYSAIKGSRLYVFDWEYLNYDRNLDDENHVVYSCSLRGFDGRLFNDRDEDMDITAEDVTGEFITSSTLMEVNYECFDIDDHKNGKHIPLEVLSFEIDFVPFKQEDIDRINREEREGHGRPA